jgi:hypothetical protein
MNGSPAQPTAINASSSILAINPAMPTGGGRRRVRIDFSPFKLSRPPSPSHPSPVLVGMDAAAGEPLSSVSSIAPRKG